MKDLEEEFKSVKWKFSRRGDGHEYILEKNHPELVRKVSEIIQREGYNDRYRSMTVRYWVHKGYKYWVMPGIAQYGNTRRVLNRVELKPISLNKF